MKLYVWRAVRADYTDGIAFAMATSVDEARELIWVDYIGANAHLWTNRSNHTFWIELQQRPEIHKKPFGTSIGGGG